MCDLKFEFKKVERKTKKPLDSDNVVNVIHYEYFACTCDEKEEKAYFDLVSNNYPYVMKEENKSRMVTFLLKELYDLDWVFKGCGVDQWMGALFEHKTKNEVMYIQCDELIYAVIAAIEISKKVK